MGKLGEEEEQALRQLASEIGGEVVKDRSSGETKVVKKVGEWTITLDTEERSSSAYEGYVSRSYIITRIRAPYVATDRFWFSITRGYGCLGCLTGCLFFWLRWVKGYPIKVGDPEFDRDFFVKGNDKPKVRALFGSPRIRQLVQSQPSIDLSVIRPGRIPFQRRWPQRVFLLYLEEGGVITDVERLKCLFELFEETLNQLCLIGSASQEQLDLKSLPASLRHWAGI